MTERAQQYNLFGGVAAPQDISLYDKVGYVLEHYPETRDDDMALIARYWAEFDALDEVLDQKTLDLFRKWLTHVATSPETLRRRRQEHQQNRTDAGHLLPSDGVQQWRRSRDGAGPPRRR